MIGDPERLSPSVFSTDRPASPHILGALASKVVGKSLVERMPFTPSFYDWMMERGQPKIDREDFREFYVKAQGHLANGLASEGFAHSDLHGGNFGFPGGNLANAPVVIDAGGLRTIQPKGRADPWTPFDFAAVEQRRLDKMAA